MTRKRITYREADAIEAELKRSNKTADAVAGIAASHGVSRLTIRKLARARGVRMAA